MNVQAAAIPAGFAEPVLDAQAAFRGLMRALSFPGRRAAVPGASETPAGWPPALAAAALALLDAETPVWLDPAADSEDAKAFIRFHSGAPIVDRPEGCQFAVILDPAHAPFSAFQIGVDQYPDRSATLLIGLPSLEGGASKQLSGPGVATTQAIAPAGDLDPFWAAWRTNRALYPLGWDAFLFAGTEAIGLPRSILVEEN